MAAINGGNILEGAAISAAAGWVAWNTGGLASAELTSVVESSVGYCSAGTVAAGQFGGDVVGGAAGGATAGGLYAGVNGGNIGQSMLTGAGYGAATGAAFGLMKFGWAYAQDYTDKSSLQQWESLSDQQRQYLKAAGKPDGPVYDSTGSLMTAGPRLGHNKGLLTWMSMAPEGSATNNYMLIPYNADSARGHFINQISKVHDFMNSWGYSSGCYAGHGVVFDTIFDIYSMSGTIPAGAYTALAIYGPYLQPAVYMRMRTLDR